MRVIKALRLVGCIRCVLSQDGKLRQAMVRERGLEPPPLAGPDPKSGVSAIPPLAQPVHQDASAKAQAQAGFGLLVAWLNHAIRL